MIPTLLVLPDNDPEFAAKAFMHSLAQGEHSLDEANAPKAKLVIAYINYGVSKEMQQALDRAAVRGLPIYYRWLDTQAKKG